MNNNQQRTGNYSSTPNNPSNTKPPEKSDVSTIRPGQNNAPKRTSGMENEPNQGNRPGADNGLAKRS